MNWIKGMQNIRVANLVCMIGKKFTRWLEKETNETILCVWQVINTWLAAKKYSGMKAAIVFHRSYI